MAKASVIYQRFGKTNISDTHADGFFCGNITFPVAFQGKGKLRVFPSTSFEGTTLNGSEASVVIVDEINDDFFSVCVMEPAQTTGLMTINWFAFSDRHLPTGSQTGTNPFGDFTSGSSCTNITFPQQFSKEPRLLISIRHEGRARRKDAMTFWLENVTSRGFNICLREMISFSGKHKDLYIDWLAMEHKFSGNMTDVDAVFFPNDIEPSAENDYAYCQFKNFSQRYFLPPNILVSPKRQQVENSSLLSFTDRNIVAWVKDVTMTGFEVCVKALPEISGRYEPVIVDFAALGGLDPCLNVTCDKFAVCRAYGAYDARCVCVTNCPKTEQNLCASHGKSYNNLCLYKLDVCQTRSNYTYYHHGNCRGFPLRRGRTQVKEVPEWSESHCQNVEFEPLTFYPDKSVHVQVSVSHVNQTNRVHDAAVAWVENVSFHGFSFCIMESGRNEGPPHGEATLEWMAYQGAPGGGMAGEVSIPYWWTGTKCQTVDVSAASFSTIPTVLITAEHYRKSLKHDAASLWLENVGKTSFKVCLRELQNFDGPHQDISVNWLAFQGLEFPVFTELGTTDFARSTSDPSESTNYAQCKDVALTGNYPTPPTVLVMPKHSSSGGNLDPQHNSIAAWTEDITTSEFKVCFKELHTSRGFDAITITYVVLRGICPDGQMYFNGFCYERITSCQSWRNASGTCLNNGGNLVGIGNAEEDVFVQHLHHGRPSWIGLNDQANEGYYLWTNSQPITFTNWENGVSKPPNSAYEDCVYSGGRKNGYHWVASSCADCRNFTCKSDFNECSHGKYSCAQIGGICVNIPGSYSCRCQDGYSGNGKTCTDFDECSNEEKYTCHKLATCVNTPGSYTCRCNAGYTGSGKTCSDLDECKNSLHNCHEHADCINNVGSFSCSCKSGYTGNGLICYADCRDPGTPPNGYRRGTSVTYKSVIHYTCARGHVISGASSTQCKSDGTWSNPVPICHSVTNVRLVGSGYRYKGRVEIYHPTYGWGTVCDDSWGLRDANVVCRQLGYNGARGAPQGARYGQGRGPILLDDVGCNGSEAYLWSCPSSGWASHNCDHREDASAECY